MDKSQARYLVVGALRCGDAKMIDRVRSTLFRLGRDRSEKVSRLATQLVGLPDADLAVRLAGLLESGEFDWDG